MQLFPDSFSEVDMSKAGSWFSNVVIYFFSTIIGGMLAGFWQILNFKALEAYKIADKT